MNLSINVLFFACVRAGIVSSEALLDGGGGRGAAEDGPLHGDFSSA